MDSNSGPSREELKEYFRNNRQYFDELAKTYYQSDREYYNKYIAPFYNNPFIASSSQPKSGRKVIVFAVLLLLIGFGAAIGLFTTKKSPEKKTYDYQKNSDKDTNYDNYIKGLQYLSEQDYDNAEDYLRRVPADDKNYKSAQETLKSIGLLKGYDTKYGKPKARKK